MAQSIDFTQCRKGSRPNGRIIDYCPECGRKGEKTIYKDGTQNYVHKAVVRMFIEVTDYCYIVPGKNDDKL